MLKSIFINFVTVTGHKDIWIIQLFAVLHAAVALGCRIASLTDDLLLTLLTMLMVVVLCHNRRMGIKSMAIGVILANAIGFALGLGTARLLALFLPSELLVFPFSTFLTTELIGLGILLWAKLRGAQDSSREGSYTWILVAFIAVISIRMTILVFFSDPPEGRDSYTSVLLDYFFTLLVISALAWYSSRLQEQARKASEEANLASYRYIKLKQQVNPHFLFNSLNVLDCMIQEQSPEEASRYTHKLAEIYRYMIKNEDRTLVSLREEMEFVEFYIDLLKVRFSEGLVFTADIRQEAYRRSVVPCCVQLLIENATKHNAVNADKPLTVTVRTTPDSIIVTNNICPRINTPTSTGIGLKYIRQQYHDISGKRIQVRESNGKFSVTVPLI